MKCWYQTVCDQYGENCETNCIRYKEMKYLMDASGIPESKQIRVKLQAGDDYEAFKQLDEIRKNVTEFVDKRDNLYLYSNETGNGKTTWSIKIMLKYFNDIWAGNGFRVRGMFIHVPTLLSKLKDFDNPLSQEYKQNIVNSDLVIWDDIGATDLSKYDLAQLLVFLDQRILNDKSNIYTGNLDRQGLEKLLGHRLASRIWNSDYVIELKGRDRR